MSETPVESEASETTKHEPFRPSPLLIASLLFLAASIGILLLVIRQNRTTSSLPPLPAPEQVIPTETAAPTAQPEPQNTALPETPSPTPLPEPIGSLRIGIAADNDDLAQELVESINSALAESPSLVDIGVQMVEASGDGRLPEEINLLVVATMGNDGLIDISLYGGFAPPPLQLESPYAPWIVSAPGETALRVPLEQLDFISDITLAVLELATGYVTEAKARIEALQAVVPGGSQNEATIFFMLGQAEARQSAYMTALSTYSTALRLRDDFPAVRLNRGNVYLALGDTSTALTAYEAASTTYLRDISTYNRAIALLHQGEAEAAKAAAIGIEMDRSWRDNLLGVATYEMGDLDNAIPLFEQAAAATDEPQTDLFNLALALRESGDTERAYLIYDELLDEEPTNSVYLLYLALTYWSEGQIPPAERYLNRALEYDENYAIAYYHRARFYAEQGEYENLLTDAQMALRLNPYLVDLHVMVGDAQRALGNNAEAIAAYDRAVESGIETAHVYASRGLAYHAQGYARTALNDYEIAVSLGADDPDMLHHMGIVLFDAGQWEDALAATLGAVNGGLDTADAHARLALALDANVRRTEAEQEYSHAIELDPGYADWTYIAELPLWSGSAVTRARTIIARLDLEED